MIVRPGVSRFRLAVLLLVVWPLACQAQTEAETMLTGAELLANCQPREADQGHEAGPTTYCLQFVGGLVGTLASLQEMAPAAEKIFCIDPEEVALETVTDDVARWLESHPDRLAEPAFLLVSEALRDNYPCTSHSDTDSTI